jgi:hypothetical protein
MPITLFTLTTIAMFLSPRIENKLKNTLEEREFSVRESVTLVVAMGVTISLVIFIPQVAIMALFLFAYSMLLFMFTYVFSGFRESRKQVFSMIFAIANLIAGTISLFGFGLTGTSIYGAVAFYCLFGFSLMVLVDRERSATGERWILAILPPAIFVSLYLFFNRTQVWFPYLLNVYGAVFAVLIVLYLGSLFNWKTTLIFAVLLTVVDSILVLVTGTMVSAARQVVTLRLPVLISLPTIPSIVVNSGLLYMSLGLGDFFFAGLLAVQTFRKFGRNIAITSVVAMCISFFIFETMMLNFEWAALPGTVMIICGWLPVVGLRSLKH